MLIQMTYESDLEPPTDATATELADWAEALMLIEDRPTAGTAFLQRRLGPLDKGSPEDTERLLSEIRSRSRILGVLYPFEVSDTGIRRRSSVDIRVYAFLLVSSIDASPFRVAREFATPARLFDLVSLAALRATFGQSATGVRFASPPSDGRPTNFPEAIKWLAEKIGIEPGGVTGPPQKKDGGVDVVVWRSFADGRKAIPMLLAQCTLRRDFQGKGRDILIDQWRSWLTTGREPLTALAVPFSIPRTMTAWDDDMRFESHVIVDRMRLCELLEEVQELSNDVLDELHLWTEGQLGELRVPAA